MVMKNKILNNKFQKNSSYRVRLGNITSFANSQKHKIPSWPTDPNLESILTFADSTKGSHAIADIHDLFKGFASTWRRLWVISMWVILMSKPKPMTLTSANNFTRIRRHNRNQIIFTTHSEKTSTWRPCTTKKTTKIGFHLKTHIHSPIQRTWNPWIMSIVPVYQFPNQVFLQISSNSNFFWWFYIYLCESGSYGRLGRRSRI